MQRNASILRQTSGAQLISSMEQSKQQLSAFMQKIKLNHASKTKVGDLKLGNNLRYATQTLPLDEEQFGNTGLEAEETKRVTIARMAGVNESQTSSLQSAKTGSASFIVSPRIPPSALDQPTSDVAQSTAMKIKQIVDVYQATKCHLEF